MLLEDGFVGLVWFDFSRKFADYLNFVAFEAFLFRKIKAVLRFPVTQREK
jgi:hypothetical protein